MPFRVALLAPLLISFPALDGMEVSCAGNSCPSSHGMSMLQIANRGAKKANTTVGSDGVVSKKHCALIGREVTDSDAYNRIKESCCLYAMAQFVKLVAEDRREFDEGHRMGYTVCEEGFALGLAQWHTCDGVGKDKTFTDLLDNIVAHANDPCTTLAKPPEQCKPRPLGCKDYAGETPVNCACSKTKSLNWGFSENTLEGSLSTDKQMLFKNVATHEGLFIDLKVEVDPEYSYHTPAPEQNKILKKNWGKITLGTKSGTLFRFSFLSQEIPPREVEVDQFVFTLAAIDGKEKSHKIVTASNIAGYVLADDTLLSVKQGPAGDFRFTPKKPYPGFISPKPHETDELTSDQLKVAVMLLYKKRTSFELMFEAAPVVDGHESTKSYRSFYFQGMSALGDHCGQ